MGLTPLDGKRAGSMVDDAAAARTHLGHSQGRPGPALAAAWYWDLASGQVEWDGGLKPLLGYAERVTDAAWRESRIHPEDRERVRASLARATIVNRAALWSGRYRFLRADGSYVTVVEGAHVVHDEAGPRGVRGAMQLDPEPQLTVSNGRTSR